MFFLTIRSTKYSSLRKHTLILNPMLLAVLISKNKLKNTVSFRK